MYIWQLPAYPVLTHRQKMGIAASLTWKRYQLELLSVLPSYVVFTFTVLLTSWLILLVLSKAIIKSFALLRYCLKILWTAARDRWSCRWFSCPWWDWHIVASLPAPDGRRAAVLRALPLLFPASCRPPSSCVPHTLIFLPTTVPGSVP